MKCPCSTLWKLPQPPYAPRQETVTKTRCRGSHAVPIRCSRNCQLCKQLICRRIYCRQNLVGNASLHTVELKTRYGFRLSQARSQAGALGQLHFAFRFAPYVYLRYGISSPFLPCLVDFNANGFAPSGILAWLRVWVECQEPAFPGQRLPCLRPHASASPREGRGGHDPRTFENRGVRPLQKFGYFSNFYLETLNFFVFSNIFKIKWPKSMGVKIQRDFGLVPGLVPRSRKISGDVPQKFRYCSIFFFFTHENFAFSNIFKKWLKSEEKLNFWGRWTSAPMNPFPKTKLGGDVLAEIRGETKF